jgi:hypothetical protein
MAAAMRRPLPLLSALALAAPAVGQDDLRDRVTRTDGKVLTGRVADPFAADELVLLQGGRRMRVPTTAIAALDLVADRVREFCERRVQLRAAPRAQAYLIDWAARRELPGLARAQATWLALVADDAGAHAFLGHERGPDGWLWPHAGRRLLRAQLDAALADEPLTLVGERFALRCDADLQTNVAALLDLEHLGAVWFARFGAALQLHEVLAPVQVVAHRHAGAFPKWGRRPVPYYVPPPHGDVARTFYAGPAPARPERLFFVGTQALLYHTLIGEVSRTDDRDRACAWLEVGLGMWLEHTMQGDAGFAAPGPLRAQQLQALAALGRGYRLTHLLHLPMYDAFYRDDGPDTAVHWAAATMFVTWLLDDGNDPPTRDRFLRFVRAALGDRQGDSSSRFDALLGTKVEALDAPWRRWLEQTARY